MSDERIIELLASLAASLAEIARHTERELPEEPNLQRPIEQYRGFEWATIEADVVKADEFGAAIVEWGGRLWTRRSPENKFGEAIWFSRAAGKDADGNNRYLRLITFRKVADAEPLSRAAERAVRAGGGAEGRRSGGAEDAERMFDEMESAATQASIPPAKPAQVGPRVSAGAGPLPTKEPPRGYDPQLCPQCGRPWRFENPACREHRPPQIQPLVPDAAPAAGTNGKPKVSQAKLGAGRVSGEFRRWAADFAQRYPRYRIGRTEDVDLYHLLMTIGSFGIAVIEMENLLEVQQRLEAHAAMVAA